MSATTVPQAERLTVRSTSDVVDAVHAARRDRAPLRIVGRGHWQRAGQPVHAARILDVSGITGIIEYVPGDFTMTVSAGTTLAEIAEATSRHNQWLPLDPFGSADGTLGATLATASAGPLAAGIGGPRDLTLGVTFVTGAGDVVHGGGRVVKNVAGFDLVRLTIGAWGTLGVITQATVRLRATPEADESFAMELPSAADAVGTLLSLIRAAAAEPLAAELVSPVCAGRIGLGNRALILIRLAGNAIAVHHQRATLAKLAHCEPVASAIWQALRQSDPTDAAVARISWRPSELARLWTAAMNAPEIDAHATLARGIVRVRLTSKAALAGVLASPSKLVVEVPSRLLLKLASPDSNEALARRLRDAFDPARILNRGILGEEPVR